MKYNFLYLCSSRDNDIVEFFVSAPLICLVDCQPHNACFSNGAGPSIRFDDLDIKTFNYSQKYFFHLAT